MNKKTDDQTKILEDNWKRALADYQNLVKRVEAEKKDFLRFANNSLISDLIPTLDILDLAAAHSQDEGVKMAVKMFSDVLTNAGLETIEPKVGDEFNAVYHECSETVVGEPANTIVELVTKGYKIGEFVLRPAKVKVFKQSST